MTILLGLLGRSWWRHCVTSRCSELPPVTQHDIPIRLGYSYDEHSFILFYLSFMKCVIMLNVCWYVVEETDIMELEKRYWLLKGQSRTGKLDLETLVPLISPPVPLSVCPGVFGAFDENRDSHIDFKEMACGISAACRGPLTERQKCMFWYCNVISCMYLHHCFLVTVVLCCFLVVTLSLHFCISTGCLKY